MTVASGIRVLGLATLLLVPAAASASDSDTTIVYTGGNDLIDATTDSSAVGSNGLTYLVPELKDAGYRITPGRKRFQRRLSFSPVIGSFGSQRLFAFRFAYSPNTWLGYEVSLGHNPASAVHAMLHTFNVILRYPIPWRIQPYVSLGYGMMTVFPGQAVNADPVTKNALLGGGGLEFYIRDDVALRGEIRGATILGQELGTVGTVAYDYLVYTLGFAFYRSLGG